MTGYEFPGLQSHPSHCVYCSRRIPADLLEWDHIVPTSRGGVNLAFNKLPCCGTCNRLKANRLPIVEWTPPRPLPGLTDYLYTSLQPHARQYEQTVSPRPCRHGHAIITATYLRAPRVIGDVACECHRPPPEPERTATDTPASLMLSAACSSCGSPVWYRAGRRPALYCSERCRRTSRAA